MAHVVCGCHSFDLSIRGDFFRYLYVRILDFSSCYSLLRPSQHLFHVYDVLYGDLLQTSHLYDHVCVDVLTFAPYVIPCVFCDYLFQVVFFRAWMTFYVYEMNDGCRSLMNFSIDFAVCVLPHRRTRTS